MSTRRTRGSIQENQQKWKLVHRLVNTLRQAKGLPLSTQENPYLTEIGLKRVQKKARG